MECVKTRKQLFVDKRVGLENEKVQKHFKRLRAQWNEIFETKTKFYMKLFLYLDKIH